MVSVNWRYWRNLSLCALVLVITSACATLAWIGYQGATLYLHPARAARAAADTPARLGINYQDITLLTQDGLKLSAWYTPPKNGAIILAAHGYGNRRSAELHALLARPGYGVISWDARAHGDSAGQLCTLSFYETWDVEAALAFTVGQPGVRHIGALGQSMGAATLIKTAARRAEIESVVADSSFPTIEDMLQRVVPFPLVQPFVRFFIERETGLSASAVRPVDDIRHISPRPVLILQGADDTVIPPNSAQRLYQAAGEPRTLWIEPGVGHVEMFTAHPQAYSQQVIPFFDRYVLR